VFLASENAVPIGYTIFMGACSMRRGIGKYSRIREVERVQAFINRTYIKSVFGQAPRLDVRNRAVGFTTLCHAINYPGITIQVDLA
jgi:hypothetical protein